MNKIKSFLGTAEGGTFIRTETDGLDRKLHRDMNGTTTHWNAVAVVVRNYDVHLVDEPRARSAESNSEIREECGRGPSEATCLFDHERDQSTLVDNAGGAWMVVV